jgi:flagellar basal-body rod protein FlgB
MPISNISLFTMLRTRMQWHQERQRLLSENVAMPTDPASMHAIG